MASYEKYGAKKQDKSTSSLMKVSNEARQEAKKIIKTGKEIVKKDRATSPVRMAYRDKMAKEANESRTVSNIFRGAAADGIRQKTEKVLSKLTKKK